MGVLAFFSYSTQSVEVTGAGSEQETIVETQVSASSQVIESSSAPITVPDIAAPTTLHVPLEPQVLPKHNSEDSSKKSGNHVNSKFKPQTIPVASEPAKVKVPRTFLHNFLLSRTHDKHKPALSTAQESTEKAHVSTALSKHSAHLRVSKSDKRAKKSALVVRSLIIGPATASTKLSPTNAKPQLSKIKSQLIEPKSANKVIAQLRVLPISDETTHNEGGSSGPIRAVCLEHPDAEEDALHFADLTPTPDDRVQTASFFDGPASIDQVTAMFNKMNIVSLIMSPNLGLGQPGDGDGLLAGAIPTAETVIKGFEEITPQLMALGYATGKAMAPIHTGVYPPTDRMSVLTYWWGLEVVLPPPSLEHLADVQSISGNVVNFLSALSLINNGVREILPFVRYIAQFIDFEFNSIKRQDQGRGVVCAATWIMPAAMVPRPWDFPDPTVDKPSLVPNEKIAIPHPAPELQAPPATPPIVIPPSLPTFADSIVGAYADSVHFQTVVPPEPPKLDSDSK